METIKTFFRKFAIPGFVFITGACVLVIEIVAVRILSPYFGNTIYSFSSIISTVLFALSIGYFAGGKLADKYPDEKLFYFIIAASGLMVISLHVVGAVLLPMWGYRFSLVEGPIVFSILLFFAQSFLLGLLSPFAVKLHSMRDGSIGVGTAAGQIFFASTFGSIAGSLSAGFWLIPHFGVNSIMFFVGFLLVVLGLFPLIKLPGLLKLALLVAVGILFFRFAGSFDTAMAKDFIYLKDGLYQRVAIHDGLWGQAPARFLNLDRDSSAAAFLYSDELAYDYTKYYALYKVLKPQTRETLVIGGGGYSVPKALLADSPDINVDVAEIEPTLLPLSQKYFALPQDPRLVNKVEDGRRLLAANAKKYDLIFSDAYSSVYSTPAHLTTREFFTLAKSRLTPDGLFVANVIGSLSAAKTSLALSEIKTFRSVFENSHFFAVSSPDRPGLQNLIFVGYNSLEAPDFASKEFTGHKNPIIRGLARHLVDVEKIDFSRYPVLTDDYAPVEYLTAMELP